MTLIAQALSLALVQFVWQGTLVALSLWAGLHLFRHRSASARYILSCGALATLLALPALTTWSLYDSSSNLASVASPTALTLTIRAVWAGTASTPGWFLAMQPWVLWIWFAGVLCLSLRLAGAGIQIAALRRTARPADACLLSMASRVARRMGMERAVRVLIAPDTEGPSLAGWIRPAILLPVATLLNLTPEQLEAVLAHEIAHLRRYDYLVNIVQAFTETLLFYHPAVWWVSGRIRHERELCCDDLAVATCGDALCYARALTVLEKLRTAAPRLALGASGSPLGYRIHRVLRVQAQEYLPSSLPGILALCLALAGVVLGTNPAHGAARPIIPPPEYPETARAQGVQGTVPVEVKVDSAGKVIGAKALGGPRELRKAAVEKVSTVEFPPGIPSPKKVDVAFQLIAQAAPQQETSSSQPDDAKLATLAGTITGAGGIPLSKSTVQLYPSPQPLNSARPSHTAITDSSGKYVFQGVPPGNYTVTADHPGYLTGSNAGKRTTQLLIGFSYVPLAEGERRTGVDLELVLYSAISGKVVDEDGDPIPNVVVQAMIYRYLQGVRQFSTIGVATTDDRGEFKVSNLGPGRVYLSFTPRTASGVATRQGNPKPGEVEQRFALSYYPGVRDLNAALPVRVSPGQDVSAIVMQLAKSPVYHVRGTVSGDVPQGSPLQVLVSQGNGNIINSAIRTAVAPDGSFDVPGIPKGEYTLTVEPVARQRMPELLASEPFVVADEDVSVDLKIQPSETLSGRVKIETPAGPQASTSSVSSKGVQIALTMSSGTPSRTAVSNEDGTFELPDVRPGRYKIVVTGVPQSGYLKSVTYGGHDAIDELDLSGGTGSAMLEVGISMSAAELNLAMALDVGEKPGMSEFMVIPDPPLPRRTWLYKRQASGPDGRLTIKNIAPGTYQIYCFQLVERFVQFDPDWVKTHESRAVKVTVMDNDRLQLSVPRITPQQVEDDDRAAHR